MEAPRRLILASASPRRAELLTEAGIAFEVRPTDVDERAPRKATPREAAIAIATRKAAAIEDAAAWVLAADTLVVHEGRLLGKPPDETEAHAILRLLSGGPHQVITGVVVRAPGGVMRADAAETTIVFRDLADEEIHAYVSTGEPLDKAGAYGIQGKARDFVSSIDGPLDNVVGLPMDLARRLLHESGFALAPR